MLETTYNYFGFVGSLLFSLSIFFFFVFWMAGVAGICKNLEAGKSSTLKLFLAVIIPFYPVIWIMMDMAAQKRELRRL